MRVLTCTSRATWLASQQAWLTGRQPRSRTKPLLAACLLVYLYICLVSVYLYICMSVSQ